ncbi:MAG: tetratricopeptide repeat protein [Dehalococcoidia bacterium]
MVFNQLSDKARVKRHRTNEAIALAMQSRWEEAVAVNKSIIEAFPGDADAFNRLGKALTQLGLYSEAREAYGHALKVEPSNAIARKNFDRLSHLKDDDSPPKERKGVSSHLFIEETGKADVAELDHLASKEVLAKMTAGDPAHLKPEGQRLLVESPDGEYLGEVEPRLGLRLIKLIEGGNEYAAAIASIGEDTGRVMIKEVFQHPSQAGRISFPVRAPDEFRSYVKDSVLKYELEDDEDSGDDEPAEEWGTGEPQRKESSGAGKGVALAEDEDAEDDAIEEG